MSTGDSKELEGGNSNADGTDPLSQLPLELSTLILSYLDGEHLFTAALVSKAWRRLVNTDTVWKRLCIRQDLRDENFPFEFKVADGLPGTKGWCRWAHIYRLLLCRRRKWEMEESINLCLTQDQSADCYGIHGTTLSIGNNDGNISVYSNVGDKIIRVQKIEIGSTIKEVHVALNTIVCVVGSWVAILNLEGGEFKAEAIFDPEGEQWHDWLSDFSDNKPRRTKILLVTKDSVWFYTTALKIYCRSSRTFIRHEVTNIVDVMHNHKWVAILRPGSVDLYRHSGKMEFSISDESFYTGLVISNCAVAFLEAQDFGDPVAAYVDLSSRKKTIVEAKNPTKLKVYKLTLFGDTVFGLNGRERFELSCHVPGGGIKWIVPLMGSKYLRPGKDFFKVICSKFIFVSPAQARLDVFDLYDKDTGNRLYTTSIHYSSYNFRSVSDTGLVVQSNCRSIPGSHSHGGYITWVSLA